MAPLPILSGLNLQLKLTDNGEPGNNDKWGLSLYNGNTLVFASQWSSNQLQELTLGGGNVLIHSGNPCNNGNKANNLITASGVQSDLSPDEIPLKVNVYPNPTENYFSLKIESSNGMDKVELKVFNQSGNVVYQTRGNAYNTFRFGEGFVSGVYYVEAIVGDQRKMIKLIKQ